MIKVTFIRNYEEYIAGESAVVENNFAHFLIENKIAKLYKDKMMRPVKTRRYKIK